MKSKRFLSLIVAIMMLLPLAMAFADGEESSGSSRAGDTATWTADGNGGTTGFSDTTTYDDIEDDDIGTSASSNMAHKTGDSIEDKIGDMLGEMSKNHLTLSHIFWDGVNGRYISVEEMGFSLDELLKIAKEAEKYKESAETTVHLTQDVQDLIEQKKQEFTDKFKRIDTGIFDINNYNPDEGVLAGFGGKPNPKIPQLGDVIPGTPQTGMKDAIPERKLGVVTYEEYMKAEFGNDIFEKHPEYLEVRKVMHRNTYDGQGSAGMQFATAPYPVGAKNLICVTPYNKTLYYDLADPGRYGKDAMFPDNNMETKYMTMDAPHILFGYSAPRTFLEDHTTYENLGGCDHEEAIQATINYRVLKDPKNLYDPNLTVIYMNIPGATENPLYLGGKLDVNALYILQGANRNSVVNALNRLENRRVSEAIHDLMSFIRDFRFDGLYEFATKVYRWEDFVEKDTTYGRAAAEAGYMEQADANEKMMGQFVGSNGQEVPDGAVDGSGYTPEDFENVRNSITGVKETALKALIAKGLLLNEHVAGESLRDVVARLISQNLANAQASADANKASLDAAKSKIIPEMLSTINDETKPLISGKDDWPELGGGPDNYDYKKAVAILMATFNIKEDDIPDFVKSLKDTITECYKESYLIEGVGPDGHIVDFETKEARYLALQAYLYMMCARDTINVQHVVVCEGNSYINNVIMSQSPMQFPAEVVGSNGVANYCWAIQCVESPYAGDVGRYVAKATNGNQLSYRFTSPGKYRIVATRNMLSTVENVVAMTYHEYWYLEETGQVIYSRIVNGHVNTSGPAQFNPAGRKGDDVCLYFNRHGEQSCYSDGDAETGIPGTVVFETYWTVTEGDGGIPPAGAFGSDSSTRQTG